MADRPVVFEGVNLGLVLAVGALSLAAGLILLGPGSTRIDTARQTLADQQKRIDAWNRQRNDSQPVSPDERDTWKQRYARLARFGAVAEDDDAALMAWVAARLDAASVKDLQVSRTVDPDEQEESHEQRLLARAPDGTESWEIRPIPLRVKFDARYADVSNLLRRMEASMSPLRIERLEMRRHYPDVRVELDVTLWTRREESS